MQFAQGQEQSEAGNAGMAGQATAALPYYIHDAMHVRLSYCLSSITVGMNSMPALVHLVTPANALGPVTWSTLRRTCVILHCCCTAEPSRA